MQSPSQRPFDDPAADAAVLLIRLGLAVLAFAVPLSAVVFRRALFPLFPVGTGLLLLAATLVPRPPVLRRLRRGLHSRAGLGGLALLGWSALSLLWTPFPFDASQRWSQEAGTLLLVVLTAALLPERTRTSNLYLFPLGLAAAALATFVAALAGPETLGSFQASDSTLERAVISLVMLAWPAMCALAIRERWAAAGWLAVGTALAAMAAWTSIALAALALGALVFAIATLNPACVGLVLGFFVAMLILVAPALPLVFDPIAAGLADVLGGRLPALNDAAQALHVWGALVLQEPLRLLTGHGFDMITRAVVSGFIPADAPRSLLFEIWYELGLVGALATALLFFGALASAGKAPQALAPFLLAEITTGFVISIWEMDATQLWWIMLLGVVSVVFATVIRGQYRTDRPRASFTDAGRMAGPVSPPGTQSRPPVLRVEGRL